MRSRSFAVKVLRATSEIEKWAQTGDLCTSESMAEAVVCCRIHESEQVLRRMGPHTQARGVGDGFRGLVVCFLDLEGRVIFGELAVSYMEVV